MSRYTYAGEFRNPVENMRIGTRVSSTVRPSVDGAEVEVDVEEEVYFIECQTVTPENVANCVRNGAFKEAQELQKLLDANGGWTPHTKGMTWDDCDLAHEYLDNLQEVFERDYDDYLEENRHSIVQMERYEMYRREQ